MCAMASSQMICGDARNLSNIETLKLNPARTIITSPPYFDTQDYGVPEQIGFGQSQPQYLDDLRTVFQHCWDMATADATMWIVVGAIRRNGKLIQLPEMLTRIANDIGWLPREQITWAKQKSLPWARLGEFRDVTEQAILLSKSDDFRFDVNDLLSPDPASTWWRRYPERYAPQGRRPTNLWHIPIPTQGSWKPGLRHLCPFPNELTFRMLALTSEPGDVVLDPFGGIGSVPAMADVMGRVGFGVDVSQSYVDRFDATITHSRAWYAIRMKKIDDAKVRHEIFCQTILELRLLKFGSLLGKQLAANGFPVQLVHVSKSEVRPKAKFKIVSGVFEVVLHDGEQCNSVLQFLDDISRKRPLSKFGVEPSFLATVLDGSFTPKYWYPSGQFWEEPKRAKPNTGGVNLTSDFIPRVKEVVEEVGWTKRDATADWHV